MCSAGRWSARLFWMQYIYIYIYIYIYEQCDVPTDLGPVLSVAAGLRHTCAVRADGRLVCFGCNVDGQCDVPADVGPVLAVAAGFHTCAVRADGRLICFGFSKERRF